MSENSLYHPQKAPEFEFDLGDCLKARHRDERGQYWTVARRLWCYDPKTRPDEVPDPWDHRQYVITEVSSLGAHEDRVSEDTLRQHYALVDQEEAREVLET